MSGRLETLRLIFGVVAKVLGLDPKLSFETHPWFVMLPLWLGSS